MSADLPPQHENETLRAYFRRIKVSRDAIRAYLPTLLGSAIEAGTARGISIPNLAPIMGVSRAWLYTPRGELPSAKYDPELVPERHAGEDDLDYYVRLRELRDVLADEIERGDLAARAKDEAKGSRMRNTDIAAAMDLSESALNKLVRRSQDE